MKWVIRSCWDLLFCGYLILILSPVFQSGYYHDDIVYSTLKSRSILEHSSLLQLILSDIISWIHYEGRLIPFAVTYTLSLFYCTNLLAYKSLIVLALVADVLLFGRFVYQLTRNTVLSRLSMLFAPFFFQITMWPDPITSLHILIPLIFLLTLVSLSFLNQFLEKGSIWHYGLSLFSYNVSLYTYEISYPFFLLHILLFWDHRKKGEKVRARVRYVLPFFLSVVAAIGLSILLRGGINHYSGSPYTVQFNGGLYFQTLMKQVASALPLSYFLFDPQNLFHYHLEDLFSGIPFLDLLALGIFSALFFYLMKERREFLPCRAFLFSGIGLALLPGVLISSSAKYQEWIKLGYGYLPVFIQYFGMVMIFMALLGSVLKRIGEKPFRGLFISGIYVCLILGLLINQKNNRLVVEQLNSMYHYPMSALKKFLESDYAKKMPDNATFLGGHRVGENRYFFYQHSGKRFNVQSREEYWKSIPNYSPQEKRVTVTPANVFLLSYTSPSLNESYLRLAEIEKITFHKEKREEPELSLKEWKIIDLRDGSLYDSRKVSDGDGDDVIFRLKGEILPGKRPVVLPGIYLNEDFAIYMEVKPLGIQVPFACILTNHPGFKNYEGFAIQQNGANQNEYYFAYGNGTQWLANVLFSLPPNQWKYLAIFVKKRMMSVYVNGSKKKSLDVGDSIRNSDMPLYIGNWFEKDRPFNGIIRKIKIINGPFRKNDS